MGAKLGAGLGTSEKLSSAEEFGLRSLFELRGLTRNQRPGTRSTSPRALDAANVQPKCSNPGAEDSRLGVPPRGARWLGRCVEVDL